MPMPYNAPVPRELAKKIALSAAVARVRVMHLRYGFTAIARKRDRQLGALFSRVLQKLTDAQRLKVAGKNFTAKKFLKLLDDADHANLAEIQYQYTRENVFCCVRIGKDKEFKDSLAPLAAPAVQYGIRAALKAKDSKFFESFGRALSEKPYPIGGWKTTALEGFLIEHWCEAKGKVPALFNLSIKELFAECQRHCNANLTKNATEKTRDKLGLIPFRPASIKKT